MRRTLSLLLILLILLSSLYSLTTLADSTTSTSTASTTSQTASSDPQLSVLTLIPLWEAPAVSLGRSFLIASDNGTELVLFGKNFAITDYSGRRFAVDEDGGYIYTIDGKLLYQIGVGIYDSYSGVQLHSKFGWLSGNGRYAVEDPNLYGTNAVVVDLDTGTTIPVDWGDLRPVSGTYPRGGHVWVRMDYTGGIIAVGEADPNGRLLVYRYDPSLNKYVRIFTSQEYGYWRMIQVSWDGTYIVGGVYDLNYTFIFKRFDDTYKLIAQLPLKGGHASVTFTDPKNLGYILVGTTNGYAHIFRFDPSTDTAVEIWSGKVGTATGRVYSCTIVTQSAASLSFVGFRAIDGDAIVVDLNTKTVVFQDKVEVGESVSVSPAGDYIVLGQRVYMVIKSDVQAGHPRVRFWGSMIFERGMQDLGSTIEFKAPARDWHLYFYSGRITISKIYTESIPVTLTDDQDILQGKLGKMYSKGLVRAIKVVESSGSVDKLELETVDVPEVGFTAEHTVAMSSLFSVNALYGWNGHGFGGATVSSATVVDVPFSAPLDAYSEIKLQQAIAIVTVAPEFDLGKELLGVFGLEIVTGGVSYAAGKGLASKAGQIAMMKAVQWGLARSGAQLSIETIEDALLSAAKAAKTAGRALGYVGVGLIIDAGVGAYAHYVTYSSVRSFIMTMPVVEDPYGNKYSAVILILPLEEVQNYAGEYEEHIMSIAEQFGIKDVGIQFIVWGRNWDEYKALLEAGSLPTIDLKSAIETTIAAKYGYSLSQLRITGVKIVAETLVHGWANLWDWITGGVKVPVVTLIAGASIQPKAVTAGGRIYSDPSVIADLLKKVTINGKDYELIAGAIGAYTDFQLQMGADRLVIDFGKRLGYFADIRVDVEVMVKKDMQPLEDFAYTATLHYDWEDTLIKIDKIGFVDMPYPMVKAVRTFIYRYGNFTNDITEAFELTNKTVYPDSPSGYLYYYITRENTKFIDPANGGIMQPCKTYVFTYFYRPPPDVALNLYLNGTQVTSTKARHATVVLNSTKTQDVEYTITFKVKRLNGLTEETIYEESLVDTLSCEANVTAYRSYLIEKYVDLAIQTMAVNGTPAFVEITAKITKAKYDYDKSNNEKTVVYYPPSTLVERYGQNATLTVYTYNAINGSAIANATITVYNGTVSYTNKTNSSGYATFNVTIGLWGINASADGYHNYSTDLYVYGNMTFRIPMLPINATPVVEPPLNTSENPITYNETVYWWLSTQVVWRDGAPFEDAIVTIRNATDNTIIFQSNTDGTGYVHYLIPNGSWIKVEVNATNPLNTSQTFYDYRELNMTQHYWVVFRLPWTSKLYEPEVMLTSLDVVIHRGQGYYFGNVSHLILIGLWTNYPQKITLRLELVNTKTNETVNVKDVTVTLSEGHTVLMEWMDVNASEGMYVRAHANITSFEADTNLDNNELWSGAVFLKPMVDIQVFVLWRPVQQKQPWTILPEDLIEIDIGIVLPINTSSVPAKLSWELDKYDLRERTLTVMRGALEDVRAMEPGTVWRNITIAVPWTSRIVIHANVTHEWEDFGYNNFINLTIPIDPDVKLTVIEKPMFLSEGQIFKVKVNITSNVEPGVAIGWVSVVDNTTDTMIKRVQITLEPSLMLEVEGKAPENPTAFWMFRVPSATHTLTALFAGYDLYTANNQETFDVTVISNQWLTIAAIAAIIIAVIAAIAILKAARHTIQELRKPKFVRRRRFVVKRE